LYKHNVTPHHYVTLNFSYDSMRRLLQISPSS